MQDRIHATLKYVLQLIPSASGALSNIIVDNFPFLTDTGRRAKRSFVEYVRNLLRVTEYAPELKSEILDLLMERHMKIDVQAQADADDLEDDIEDLLLQDAPLSGADPLHRNGDEDATEDGDDNSDVDSELGDDEDLDDDEQRENYLKLSIEKLDAGLDIVFKYYEPYFSKDNIADSQRIFDQLLSQFRKTVLPTYRSRHTQFILFHFAQTSSELATSFIDALDKVLKDKTRSPVLRISAAAYMASFIARGARVSTENVLYTFDTLAAYIDTLRKAAEPTCRGPDLRRYSTYYAAIQALVYIFCFRWRDLLNDPEDCADETDEELLDGRELIWASGVKESFSQNFMSKLNPLKICAPEIVEEFARIAHHLQFLYVFQIIEANKRVRLSQQVNASSAARETSLTGLTGERWHQLEAYFPFDPYRLPLSKKWMEGEYNEWKGVPEPCPSGGQQDRDSSDGEDEEEASDEEMEDDRTETPDGEN